jgi:hypothetical protein
VGIVVSVVIMAGLFYLFLFPNPSVVLLVVEVLVIVLTRPDLERRVKSEAGLAVTGIFVYFLLAQPLILEHEAFGRNELGHLVGALPRKEASAGEIKRDYRDNAAVVFVDLSIVEDREQWASFVAEHSPGVSN